jgi:hypothetical protein
MGETVPFPQVVDHQDPFPGPLQLRHDDQIVDFIDWMDTPFN